MKIEILESEVLASLLPAFVPEASFHRAGQFAAEKSLPEKIPEVIADAHPLLAIDPTIVVNPFRLHLGQLFHPVAVKSDNRVGQIGKCFPIWFHRIVGSGKYASACVFAGQFAAEKSLPAKMPEVIADARPHLEIDRTIVVANLFRLHLGQLFHSAARKSGNRVGQIGKCFPI